MQRTVDVHTHWYPKEYLDYLISRGDSEVTYARHDGGTHYRCYYKGVPVAHIDRAGHYDLDARIKDLDAAGLDTQILSITIPGPETLERDKGIYWAKKNNDALAKAEQDYPGRFFWMASLPYQDPDAACKELERCYQMGCKGVQMFSNFNGKPIAAPEFDPIYACQRRTLSLSSASGSSGLRTAASNQCAKRPGSSGDTGRAYYGGSFHVLATVFLRQSTVLFRRRKLELGATAAIVTS